MAAKKGDGIREVSPGKFVATMYDSRVKGGTKHIGTFKVGKGPNEYRNRTEAQKAAKKAKDKAEELRDLQLKGSGSKETIEAFAARWPRDYPRRAPTTNHHNAQQVKALVRDFGDRALDGGISQVEAHAWIHGGIVPAEIRTVARKWHKAVVHPDGDVEVPNHRGNHIVVRAMFNNAIKTGLCGTNPFSSLQVAEAVGRRGDAITVLTETELALLSRTAIEVLGDYGHHFAALLETLAWTGLRPGEAWALNIEPSSVWNYPDFAAGEIHVKFQIDKFGQKRRPKWDTKGKGRAVFMLPPAQQALRKAIEDPDGGPDRPSGEVFYTINGKRLTGRNVGHYWNRVRYVFWSKLPAERRSKTLAEEGGPELGKIPADLVLYQLRHYYGTQLAEMGMTPPEIADQMGHKDGGELAMKRYIHPRKESVKRAIADRFAEHQRRRAIGE